MSEVVPAEWYHDLRGALVFLVEQATIVQSAFDPGGKFGMALDQARDALRRSR